MKNNFNFNISGGQVNIAQDNAAINAVQNNTGIQEELELILKSILDNLAGVPEEQKEQIIDVVEIVREEAGKDKPKKARLFNCAASLAPLITTVNGMPVLAQNMQRLVEFLTGLF